jgi:hypothetical protein
MLFPMNFSVRSLTLCAGLGCALLPGARGDTPLAARSPFLPADGLATASTENTPLELRGIMSDSRGYRFSIYDPSRHTADWVRLNEAGHDFKVTTHDVAKDTITLDYQGRMLTLALHASKVVGVAISEPMPSGPRPNGMTPGVGPVPKPPSPEEAARYNRAVEEINRRRALREKGGPMPMPGQMSNNGLVPVPGPR